MNSFFRGFYIIIPIIGAFLFNQYNNYCIKRFYLTYYQIDPMINFHHLIATIPPVLINQTIITLSLVPFLVALGFYLFLNFINPKRKDISFVLCFAIFWIGIMVNELSHPGIFR